jgi:nicotinic acid mononucleotide adenylyltransferase
MNPVQDAITGKEKINDLSHQLHTLRQFYFVFNNKNLSTMSANWDQSDTIAMNNTLVGIKRGLNEIKSVYEKIFHLSYTDL